MIKSSLLPGQIPQGFQAALDQIRAWGLSVQHPGICERVLTVICRLSTNFPVSLKPLILEKLVRLSIRLYDGTTRRARHERSISQ